MSPWCSWCGVDWAAGAQGHGLADDRGGRAAITTDRRDLRHDDQPLSVLLAERPGSRGNRPGPPTSTPLKDAPARGAARISPHPARHLCRHGGVQPDRAGHHDRHRRDAARGRPDPDRNRRRGGRGAASPSPAQFAFVLFSLGIIGTGLLAMPVLAGSAAYAIGEARGWMTGLEHKPREAYGFYSVIGAATLLGIADRLVADRPDQGAVLERGDQRRRRRADHGGDDDRRLAAIGDGALHRAARHCSSSAGSRPP